MGSVAPFDTLLRQTAVVLALCGCTPQTGGCLAGDDGICVPASACSALSFRCAEPWLTIGRLAFPEERPFGLKAQAALGDIVLSNERLTAVIDDIPSPHMLAPSGGSLIDLVPRHGGSDELNQALQAVGILPDDAARYHHVELIDQHPERVAAIFRGTLDGRPEIQIVTRYELRGCEPGLRVRSELYHAGRDALAVFAADGHFWGNRGVTPFIPLRGQGHQHPDLDLEALGDAFRDAPWLAGTAHTEQGAAYAVVACDTPALSGFHGATLSAVGRERTLLMPGDSIAFERFIAVAPGPGQQLATDIAHRARAQLVGDRTSLVRGRVVGANGNPVGGDPRRASLWFYTPASAADAVASRVPQATALPDANGDFELLLPRGHEYRAELHVLGRARGAPHAFRTHEEEVLLGELPAFEPAMLEVSVADTTGSPLIAELVLVPAPPTRAAEVTGSVLGAFEEEHCAPYLGPPHAGSPACNRVLLDATGRVRFAVPPGEYYLYATRGPFWTLSRERVVLGSGSVVLAELTLEALPLLADGVLSADLHVHGGASFDSSLPERDRVLSFVALGVDVIAATDHDVITDYGRALVELGLQDRVRILPGVETTGQILFLRPPGSSIPRVIGHFNFWPLRRDPSLARNGAPDDERLEPGALFERVAELYSSPGVAQLNHPFGDAELGRDTGYLSAIEYDPRTPVPPAPDGSRAGELVRRPGKQLRNLDYDVQEVMNGTSVQQFLNYRSGWFSFLNQGILRAGTANSDSHTLAVEVLGYPRNLVLGGHSLSDFDMDRFNASIRRGEMVGTNGPVLEVCLVDDTTPCRGPLLEPVQPGVNTRLRIRLLAAPFVPLEEIRLIVNGVVVKTLDLDFVLPHDPFGKAGLLRYEGELDLLGLLRADHDSWLLVEAGMRLPLAGDLEDADGLVDTTDNDANGRVDASDGRGRFQEPGRVSEEHVRFHVQALAPGILPTAFTNPFLIDWAGDGWSAPGQP